MGSSGKRWLGFGNGLLTDNRTRSTHVFQNKGLKLTVMLHRQAVTNLLKSPCKEKHVFQVRGDDLHNQGECGGYLKRPALTDSAHFLLLCNRDHPVRAGTWADGGFVCVWIGIGDVLFYSFFMTVQEKGKRCWDGGVQTEWRWKPQLHRVLRHSVITSVWKKLMLVPHTSTYTERNEPTILKM